MDIPSSSMGINSSASTSSSTAGPSTSKGVQIVPGDSAEFTKAYVAAWAESFDPREVLSVQDNSDDPLSTYLLQTFSIIPTYEYSEGTNCSDDGFEISASPPKKIGRWLESSSSSGGVSIESHLGQGEEMAMMASSIQPSRKGPLANPLKYIPANKREDYLKSQGISNTPLRDPLRDKSLPKTNSPAMRDCYIYISPNGCKVHYFRSLKNPAELIPQAQLYNMKLCPDPLHPGILVPKSTALGRELTPDPECPSKLVPKSTAEGHKRVPDPDDSSKLVRRTTARSHKDRAKCHHPKPLSHPPIFQTGKGE